MQKGVGRNRALQSCLNEILKIQKSKGKHYSRTHTELVMKAFSSGLSSPLIGIFRGKGLKAPNTKFQTLPVTVFKAA